ncbi:MAG: hypothetical protein ACI3XN_02145 [Eubacteriales bacterium]
MKKRICLALLIVTVFTFVACGTQTTSAKSVVPESASEISLPTNITQETLDNTKSTATKTLEAENSDDNLIKLDMLFDGIEQYVEYSKPNGYVRADFNFPNGIFVQLGESDIYLSKRSYIDTDSVLKIVHINECIGEIQYYTGIYSPNSSGGESLKPWGVVKVGSAYYREYVVDNEYLLFSGDKEFVVPNQGEYLTSQEQLTPTIVEAIKQEVLDKGPKGLYVELLYCTYKPGIELAGITTSCIALVYRYTYSYTSEDKYRYGIYMFDDIHISPNQEEIIDSIPHSYRYGYKTRDEALDAVKAHYNVVEDLLRP